MVIRHGPLCELSKDGKVRRLNFTQAILAGDVPYAEYAGHLAEFRIIRAIRAKKLPPKPQLKNGTYEQLWDICTSCWKFSPKDRLTIDGVLERLYSSMKSSSTNQYVPL